MTVDCDLARTTLSIIWFVVGVAIAGPIAFFLGLGRRCRTKPELYYRGRGGEER